MANPISDFFTETFDLLSSGQFENLVFRPQSQGGQISGSPELVGTLPQALFFSAKKGPIFLQALSFWVRCRRRLFFSAKKGPIFLGTDPPDLGTDHQGTARKYLARHGSSGHGTEIFGTARIHQIWARHGTGRPWRRNATNVSM